MPLRGGGLTLARSSGRSRPCSRPRTRRGRGLLLNSPGGSPVQSSLIAQRIRALAEEKKRPVLRLRRGRRGLGRLLAGLRGRRDLRRPGLDRRLDRRGERRLRLPEALARLGVERRVHTTGDRKALLDPFRPERAEDLELLREIQGDILGGFIAWVRRRRGAG